MTQTCFLLAFPILLLTMWGCNSWRGELPENILAQVNQEQITINEFDRELKDLMIEPAKKGKGRSLTDLKQACLNQWIERRILVQEARRSGIRISQEELNQAILDIKKDYPGEGLGEKLYLKGTTWEEWKLRLEERLLAEKLIRTALRYGHQIDEKEALQYYETHLPSFETNRKVRVRQIVVAEGEEAIQILKRLKKGESFEKLAKEKSLGPESNNGGDLGYFSQGEKPPEFDGVFSMEVGTISEVIKSPYGYHIFKLEEKTEPRQISFDEAKPRIIQDLRQKKGEEEYQRWSKELRNNAKVKINKKWLRS